MSDSYKSNDSYNEPIFEKLRSVVMKMMDIGDFKTALYWSNKILSFSNCDKSDVLKQAKCFYYLKEYHRASHCIKSRNLHEIDLACRYLAAKSHYAAQEYREAFEILDFDENLGPLKKMDLELETREEHKQLESSICLLKGHIYEALDNRGEAVEWFKKALLLDAYCYEALEALVQHQMLNKQEEEDLLSSIRFENQFDKEEARFIKFLYTSALKKYAKPDELQVPIEFSHFLSDNVDILTSLAERHYYNCDFQQCFQLTNKVLKIDIYHTQCLPIHISCLMELQKTNLLFDLAHKLVDLYPENATSWYAVGCYYLMINKMDAARRFLSKATTLDNVFGPAWLLYGHSFAIESEHDQAMAAYFKASHLMKGCHLPLLYIGLEYGLTDNNKLAEKFFQQALAIAPNDPFVLHELGVISYQIQEYQTAYKHFTSALSLIRDKQDATCLPEKWEPLINNIGHVLRKLKRYDEALEYHKQALVLIPLNPSTYSAIGFVYAWKKKYRKAVDYFHKALGLKRDDQCAKTMLDKCMEHLSTEFCLWDDELPLYEDEAYMKKYFASSNLADESSTDDALLDDNDLERSLSENETENNASGLDVEMDLSP
ncbi:cell division cycle protein 16 homolog [Panonychus citri]|uniref:cell division cycle protein 16 homolog n=1 Tax=Panonychus citri TaxID=50023 RepID=UPI00230834CB|nr:cell division cycle protein 16 homolog [Panonychus citri]